MAEGFHVVALATGITLATVSQLSFKLGARASSSTAAALFSRWTLLGYAMSLVVTVCTVIALKGFDLKLVTAWTGLTFALVTVLSWLLLKESLSTRQLLGTLMIVVGIAIF